MLECKHADLDSCTNTTHQKEVAQTSACVRNLLGCTAALAGQVIQNAKMRTPGLHLCNQCANQAEISPKPKSLTTKRSKQLGSRLADRLQRSAHVFVRDWVLRWPCTPARAPRHGLACAVILSRGSLSLRGNAEGSQTLRRAFRPLLLSGLLPLCGRGPLPLRCCILLSLRGSG